MKTIIILTSCIIMTLISTSLQSQSEKVHIEGAIILENSIDSTPQPGTIRWTGLDFEGYNGYNWVSLSGQPLHGTVTDIDGNVYRTIRMGVNIWMAENLRTTRYNDGDDIPLTSDDNTWSSTNSGARATNGSPRNVEDFGYLYNGHAVKSNKLCPVGWEIPLVVYYRIVFQMTSSELNSTNATGAGGWLKSQDPRYFYHSNVKGSNSMRDAYGFDARGGGKRNSDGSFDSLKEWGYYWTKNGNRIQFGAELTGGFINNSAAIIDLNNGYSVRCVKDLED